MWKDKHEDKRISCVYSMRLTSSLPLSHTQTEDFNFELVIDFSLQSNHTNDDPDHRQISHSGIKETYR